MQAVNCLPERVGHRIFMDNLFTSVALLVKIRDAGHSACGTCRTGRGLPSCIENMKKAPKNG